MGCDRTSFAPKKQKKTSKVLKHHTPCLFEDKLKKKCPKTRRVHLQITARKNNFLLLFVNLLAVLRNSLSIAKQYQNNTIVQQKKKRSVNNKTKQNNKNTKQRKNTMCSQKTDQKIGEYFVLPEGRGVLCPAWQCTTSPLAHHNDKGRST